MNKEDFTVRQRQRRVAVSTGDPTPASRPCPISVSSGTLWIRAVKRLFDVAASLLILVLLLPIFVLAAACIKITSPGPLFFVQDRAGWNGRVFRLPKFRTMKGGRKPDAKELVPLDHPEITRIGRLLRRLKIDELPQLVCVLSGEMSLVGPRPTLPDQVAAYDEFRRQRLLVRPGLTGLAQVYSSASATWEERILFDIAYVRRCGFILDLLILLRTVWVVIVGEKEQQFCDSPFARFVTPPPGYGSSAVNGQRSSDT